MNWDILFKYLYKCFLISYLVLWSMQLNANQQKYLTIFKDTLFNVQTNYFGIEPTFLKLGKQLITYYSHYLAVVAVTILFSWSISRPLVIISMLFNFLLLSTRKQFMFIGVDVALLAIVLQVNLKNQKEEKQKTT